MDFISKILDFVHGHMAQTILGFVYMLVEYFLGKTEIVQAGSVLEMVLNSIKWVLEKLGIKKAS